MTNVSNGAPAWLAPDYRYAGDDWSGDNALTYIVYDTPPVYGSDGLTIVTPGVALDLTGCAVTGTLRYMKRCGSTGSGEAGGAPVPVTMIGALVDADSGVVSLSLPKAQTLFPRQAIGPLTDPSKALLLVQPKIVSAAGAVVTIGLQPLFVF